MLGDKLSDKWLDILDYNPKLSVSRSANKTEHIFINDKITYIIKLKNVGNVVLTNIDVLDVMHYNLKEHTSTLTTVDKLDVGEEKKIVCEHFNFIHSGVYLSYTKITGYMLHDTITETCSITVDMPIYVSDTYTSMIYKYDNTNTIKSKWVSYNPYCVVVDKLGCVYASDSNNSVVYKYSPDNKLISVIKNSFNYPTGLAVDKNNNLYVVDTRNYKIQMFSTNGNFILEIKNLEQFGIVYNITVDKHNTVYISDVDKNKIHIYDCHYKYSSLEHEFNRPYGVAVDSKNCLYVLDSYNSRVQKFSSSSSSSNNSSNNNRKLLTTWGSYGSKPGQFKLSYSICVDRLDFVYVADTYNNRVQKFTYDGVFVSQFASRLKMPYSVSVI